jgi:hypothetical protein
LGHRRRICNAFSEVKEGRPYDREAMISYIANAGWLFLKTKQAFEEDRALVIGPFEGGGGVKDYDPALTAAG